MKPRLAFTSALLTVALAPASLVYMLNWHILQVPNATSTEIYSVNNSNEMVGHYNVGAVQHGLAVINGKPNDIDDPKGNQAAGGTWCGGVNSSGTIVGYYYTNPLSPVATGFIYDPSNQNFTDVTYPDATNTYLSSVNDNGEIVGAYTDADGSGEGFFSKNGGQSFTVLTPPNSIVGVAMGNNNAGLITVQGENSNGTWSAYLYDAANLHNPYTLINVPTAVNSYVEGINNHASIVYAWEDSSGNFHGAVKSILGKFLQLDEPNAGAAGTYTDGINDNNVIVGTFDYMNSNAGFLVTATK
jgi:hypothetical protein